MNIFKNLDLFHAKFFCIMYKSYEKYDVYLTNTTIVVSTNFISNSIKSYKHHFVVFMMFHENNKIPYLDENTY